MRLVYWSRNRVPEIGAQLEQEIEQILAVSRVNNAQAGVTGALMFNSGCFAQILEGPAPAVGEVFERIQRDDRHGEVLVLECGAAQERAFPAWSMAHVGGSLRDRDLFSHVGSATGFDARQVESREIFRVLKDLVEAQ